MRHFTCEANETDYLLLCSIYFSFFVTNCYFDTHLKDQGLQVFFRKS